MISLRQTFASFLIFSLFLPSKSIVIDCQSEEKTFNGTSIEACVPTAFNLESSEAIEFTKVLDFKALFIEKSKSSQIPINFPEFLPQLEYFVFIESNLVEITKNSLQNLTKLLELNLQSNKISKISETSFESLQNLLKLSLTSNEISEIHESSFKPLTELREIYLDDNNIETLSPKLFRDNLNLKVIHIEMNKIQKLPVTLFHGLSSLSELKVDYNEIEALPSRIFIDNVELKNFTISNNKISLIGGESFKIYEKLEVHNFLDNPCTEELMRVYEIDELKSVVEESCKPSCEDENQWMREELEQSSKRGKRSAENFEGVKEEILREIEGKIPKFDYQKFYEEFKKVQEENLKLSEGFKKLTSDFEKSKQNAETLINANMRSITRTSAALEDQMKKLNDDTKKEINDEIIKMKVNLNEKKDEIYNLGVSLNRTRTKLTKEVEDLSKRVKKLEKEDDDKNVVKKEEFNEVPTETDMLAPTTTIAEGSGDLDGTIS